MIKVFGSSDTVFDSNGDAVLKPFVARVRKEDNGEFFLHLECGIEENEYLTEGRIIVAPTPQGEQAFRINNTYKTRSKITTDARHVFFDAENYLIADSYVVDMNANGALNHLNSATEPESEFTMVSDVSSTNSFRCVRKSLLEAVNTVVERWGGHLVRNNFNIALRETIGADNGVVIRYAKNLREITCEQDWSNVVTKLMPEGFDGILLPEVYVTSDIQYDRPYTKTVYFDQDIAEEDYYDADGNLDEEAYQEALIEDLRQQAQAYVDENCLPKVNYTLRADPEVITDIGDTVEVIDERLGVNLMTNVIAYEYDCILGKYTQIEFGNFQQKLSSLISSVNATAERAVAEATKTVRVTLGQELSEATARIWSALGDSYVIYDGDKILVVDQLPKESATNVLMINSAGIGFSSTGINGTFNSAWLIDGTLDMQMINVINLTADLIRGGTLMLGSQADEYGILEIYDEANNLIGRLDKTGLKMYGADGSYVLMNNSVGFAGYDTRGNKVYWADADQFHMAKAVVENEITLCGLMRFIPIDITNGSVHNVGIGLVGTQGVT
ncbi:MAG: phage tail protein [Anaerolineaceae bacterium]|nr:phage tail protein [Anaerolineaceae bacterium]